VLLLMFGLDERYQFKATGPAPTAARRSPLRLLNPKYVNPTRAILPRTTRVAMVLR